jgi:peptide subunit release factor RF-3
MTLGISKLRYVDRRVSFKGIPSFSPEHFRYINNADPMKAKQLDKGVDQLMDEGVAQLFTLEMNNRKSLERLVHFNMR